jgi:hypothetical protein
MKEYESYREQFRYREQLYQTISQEFNIQKGLYPGSYIDIAPSFYIPNMTYIDNFKGAIQFFQSNDEIINYIETHKAYSSASTLQFYGNDYYDELPIEPVELIISQYAGFVGQATKRYLKQGGILLANDSHGDATLAYLDPDFQFIGVVSNSSKIAYTDLDQYFTFKRERPIDRTKVIKTMKGPKYQTVALNYIFRYQP